MVCAAVSRRWPQLLSRVRDLGRVTEIAPGPACRGHGRTGRPGSFAVTPLTRHESSESESVSVETFERDLLQVVSNRTGYPISVLNLDMALESELGIDSIKIIEIFSKLKRYHVLFRLDNEELEEEDVEDKLERFAKLTTLRDIINLIPSSTESAGGSVERYALKSADVSSDEKKNGYPATKL